MTRLASRIRRFFRREDGTATIEFVIFLPITLTIFMASVESGWYMAKHVMLERGLDMVMRELRLGTIQAMTHDEMRGLICDLTPILNNCDNILMIEMTPVSTLTFDMPALPPTCVERQGDGTIIQPMTTFVPGGSNEIMIVRICAVQDPMFPTTGIGLELRADALGGYQMVAASVYVNEPR